MNDNGNFLYHCTTYDNLKSILKNGLIPHKPTVSGQVEGVYLCSLPIDWMEWATSDFTKRGALLKIDITNLELYGDLGTRIEIQDIKNYKSKCPKAHRGIYSKKIIPSDLIIGIEIETETGSGEFIDVDIDDLKKDLFLE